MIFMAITIPLASLWDTALEAHIAIWGALSAHISGLGEVPQGPRRPVVFRLHYWSMDVFSHISYHSDQFSLLRACSSCPSLLAPGWYQQCAVHVMLCCSLEAQIQDSEKLLSRDCFGVSKLLDSQIWILLTCCTLIIISDYNECNIQSATLPFLDHSDCRRIQKKHQFKSKTSTSGQNSWTPKFESIVCISTARIWWEGIPDSSQRQMCCDWKMDHVPIFGDGHQSMKMDV